MLDIEKMPLYQIVESVGFDERDTEQVVLAAMELPGDLNDNVRALAVNLISFGLFAREAEDFTEQLCAATNGNRKQAAELCQQIGRVAPVAHLWGIALEVLLKHLNEIMTLNYSPLEAVLISRAVILWTNNKNWDIPEGSRIAYYMKVFRLGEVDDV